MRLIDSDLWFCADCTILAVNGEPPENERAARACAAGLEALSRDGQSIASNSGEDDGEQEFSRSPCDCCHSYLAGSRSRFALFTSAPMPANEAAELQRDLEAVTAERDEFETKIEAAEETIAELREALAELRPIAEHAAGSDLRARWILERAAELGGAPC